MTSLILAIFAGLAFYAIGERVTRNWTAKRVGGLTFVRMGRLSFSYSISRK